MATTTITGTINGVNNTALANKWITFRLVQLGTDSGATATVAQSVDSVQTDASGDFSIDVWNNGDSGKPSVLEITIDGSKPESVIIPTGTVSIELWDLIENYQADGSTSEQVPVVSNLFLRKSTNLSDVGNKLIASQNLDLEVGVDVQAHSATLDATTASFTTADETKLDGIEALADVTDATNIAASGGYVAGGTDVALTDGGTGASDAPTARANLGVPSESDTLLKSGNLLGLTDTAAARANLGVPSASEGLATANNLSELTPTASVARVNIGVPSTAEAVLVANNLSDVDPVIARANLGVPSSQEGLAAANNLSELTPTASTARTNIDVPSNAEAVLVANNLSDVDPVIARANLGVTSSADALSISGNLSELAPTSSTARTNLGVAIGSDVQAHSAVLDATDAIFTTAKDAAISANTANIASNDTDIGTLTGSVVQNQAAIALNTAKVTNATHTGDVTGDTALTIAPSAVDIPMLSATGTPDATSFLRGDNTWSVPAGGAGGDVGTDAIWDAKGDLAGGTGPNAATRLPLGADLQVLTVNSAEATGMEWTTLPSGAGGVATDPVWDAKGDIAGGTGLDTATRLAVGTNSQVLTADSAEATGMKWSTLESVATDPIWDAKGDLVGGTGADASARLEVGGNNSVLTADSTAATGMKWATVQPSDEDLLGTYPYTTYFSSDSGSDTNNRTVIDSFFNGQNMDLKSIYIGSNATLIADGAFASQGVLPSAGLIDRFIIPRTITRVGDSAFRFCNNIEEMIIGSGVSTIGDSAFSEMGSLSYVRFFSMVAPTIESGGVPMFDATPLLTEINVPIGATGYGSSYGGKTVVYV